MPNTQAFIHTFGGASYWETWVFLDGEAKGLVRSLWPADDLTVQQLIKKEHTKITDRFIRDGYNDHE